MVVLKELGFAINAENDTLVAYPLDNSSSPILSGKIVLNSIDNELLCHEFRKFIQVLAIPQRRVCHVCGISFESKRSSKTTHDNTCRSTKRHIVKKLHSLGADTQAFLDEFILHVNALSNSELDLAKDYLLLNMKEYKSVINALSDRDLKYLILSNQGI